jgi:hypothetical protein
MAFPRIGGAGIPLNVGMGIGPPGGAAAGLTNAMTLLPGKRWVIPAGVYAVDLDLVSNIEFLDPVTGIWRVMSAAYGDGHTVVNSDGANFAIANMTGFPVGGLITNAGSGYTNGIGAAATGLAITPSAGGSTWVPIVGGALATAVTITAAGSGFTFAPHLIIDAPPNGGFQATATCTISAGAINAVTVINQGAGYVAPPKITIVNDVRDLTAAGGPGQVNTQAVLTAALTGSGTLTGMYPAATGQGTVLTAVPTFTFSPASTTAATAIMNFAVTSYTQTAGGTAYGTSAVVTSANHTVAGASVLANPMHTTQLTTPRPCRIVAGLSGGALTTANQVVEDSGSGIQVVPILGVQAYGAIATAVATATANVGGVNSQIFVQEF